jgi:hypothetical protein
MDHMSLLAVDLLHLELRLRRCERSPTLDLSLDGDSNICSAMIPGLLANLDAVNESKANQERPVWRYLKSRCYWLVFCFFLWRRRQTHSLSESKEAEERALFFLDLTMRTVGTLSAVKTPHLQGVERCEAYWHALTEASLSALRGELQASSVVRLAQERFQAAQRTLWDAEDPEMALSAKEIDMFYTIGADLLERYSGELADSRARLFELIDDVLSMQDIDEVLVEATAAGLGAERIVQGPLFEQMLPLSPLSRVELRDLSAPSILTILCACVALGGDNHVQKVSHLLSELVRCIWDIFDVDNSSSKPVEGSAPNVYKFHPKQKTLKLHQCSQLMILLVRRIRSTPLPDTSECWSSLVTPSASLASALHDSVDSNEHESILHGEDATLLMEVGSLVGVLQDNGVLASFCGIVVAIILRHCAILKSLLEEQKQGKQNRGLRMIQRVDLLCVACCELGSLLSLPAASHADGKDSSSLLDSVPDDQLRELYDDLLFMWSLACGASSGEMKKSNKDLLAAANCVHKFVRGRLKIPVAVSIASLCGTASKLSRTDKENNVCLSEFYDSDSSAVERFAVADNDDGQNKESGDENFFRAISQSALAVRHLLEHISDDEAVAYNSFACYLTSNGPLLPLVIARGMNALSALLLTEVSAGGSPSSLWSDFPYGARSVGNAIDLILHRAYKCLHSVVFGSGGDSKEPVSGTTLLKNYKRYDPENAAAAADLYRCLMRAYPNGRRTPPRAALEIVVAALPPTPPDPHADSIRRFLVSPEDAFQLAGLRLLIQKGPGWENAFDPVLSDEQESEVSVVMDESTIVRRGIARVLAEGPVPIYQDAGGDADDRATTSNTELELSRKFQAIVDDICYGAEDQYKGWYKAAQCIWAKSELIADRLGLCQGFARNKNFSIPARVTRYPKRRALHHVLKDQEDENHLKLRETGWVAAIGPLSPFIDHSWSSLESLEQFAIRMSREILRSPTTDLPSHSLQARIWKDIEEKRSNDIVGWQQACGGLFVSSLRKVALRCMCLGLRVLYMRDKASVESNARESEMMELMGVSLYAELMASQRYGFPMQELTNWSKRELAEAARDCFVKSLEAGSRDDSDNNSQESVWDLDFMIGKVSALAGMSSSLFFGSFRLHLSVLREDG